MHRDDWNSGCATVRDRVTLRETFGRNASVRVADKAFIRSGILLKLFEDGNGRFNVVFRTYHPKSFETSMMRTVIIAWQMLIRWRFAPG